MEFFVFIPHDVGNLPINLNMVHYILDYMPIYFMAFDKMGKLI
jgi:hypothetical protein